ncbi:glycosyltransferase family 4 protein [Marinibactrum halimedae]|uniref:Glycosyl transferase n=1 Tax=Marinibactrum halimedae TaxID=1444977 RepID=A0AA37T5E6_9GAMM|nr:glycosyltransferase family 4 protein [Marinibactrum halimedae]MCD9460470.1 glycosyltransferase family 4 protein [Marinibactrum halimedae]GLS25876.1 glycosyl transferase [Marinibactrum halimedae]
MKVLQVLPELNSGGVERGTVEFARHLVKTGHESLVMSAGGKLVPTLEQQGSQHLTFPVHKKSLLSLRHVLPLRRLIKSIKPDIIHVRSRLPAWLIYLAIGKFPRNQRPGIVSTFHGLYSTNRYSAVMGKADKVIAISDCVKEYITHFYPSVPASDITVVHRGVDTETFQANQEPPTEWREAFYQSFPVLEGKPLIIMPGRLSRWKGQTAFIDLIHRLKSSGQSCHGIIIGGTTPGKDHFKEELLSKIQTLNLSDDITLLGHRNDIEHLFREASLVCNLSLRPEPFGRTVIEALAVGCPVLAFDMGGPAESLRYSLPTGLISVTRKDANPRTEIEITDSILERLTQTAIQLLTSPPNFTLDSQFTLDTQARKTLEVYQSVYNAVRR